MRRIRRQQPKTLLDYVLPFLLLVSIGIIGVIGFQVWSQWNQQGKADAYFYVAEGNAKILQYGETDWSNAFSGTKLLIGDSLKTLSSGRTVVDFFNGTLVRMENDTAITLEDLVKTSDRELIKLELENGMIWLNGKKSVGVREARYEVHTSHLNVKAKGTAFAVESTSVEAVRVFEGEVSVDITIGSGSAKRVAQTISVSVGQELILDEAALRAFEENKSPSLLKAISDEFKNGSWYSWNIQQDASPTDFSLPPARSGDEEEEEDDAEDENVEEDEEEASDESDEDEVNNEFGDSETGKPSITSPTFTSTRESSFILSGSVPSGTAKVEVVAKGDGYTSTYVLSKFISGSTTFSYNVSAATGNFKPGENTYSVYAYDGEGKKGEPATVVITYEKEKVEITDALQDPAVVSFNGVSSSEVTESTVTVKGTVKGAEKVVVNGYTLSKFEAGSLEWSYVAGESIGNMKPGLNEYEVYAVDPDGKRSAVVKFAITYKKAETSTPTPATPTTPSQEEVPDGF